MLYLKKFFLIKNRYGGKLDLGLINYRIELIKTGNYQTRDLVEEQMSGLVDNQVFTVLRSIKIKKHEILPMNYDSWKYRFYS